MAKAKGMTVIMVIIALAAVAAVVILFMLVSDTSDTTTTITDTITATTGLTGKPGTLSVDIRDGANDNAQIAAPIFIISSPTVGTDEITGAFAADGTAVSASGRTDVTSGISVGMKYIAMTGNDSIIGFPSDLAEVGTEQANCGQSCLVDVVGYTITNSVEESLEDEDGNAIGEDGATRNLTLPADAIETLELFRIKVNQSNAALNLAGFYIDRVADSNISSISIVAGDTPALTKTALNLESTEADDDVFLFDSPILLKEQESVNIDNALKFEADAVGCVTEDVLIYTLDRIWTKSSIDSSKMVYAYESDASTSADVGITNPVFTMACSAS